jgi:hypothetical protein
MEDVTKLAIPILHYIHTSRKDLNQVGIATLGTFIIMVLSAERDFAIALNKIFSVSFKTELPHFIGNHADYLILACYQIIADGHVELGLGEWLLSIIANVTPYVKTLSQEASAKLVKLFDKFSKSRHVISPLLTGAGAVYRRYLTYLLQSFNNSIQYQYDGNVHLAYAIVEYRDTFTRVAALSWGGSPSSSSSSSSSSSNSTSTSTSSSPFTSFDLLPTPSTSSAPLTQSILPNASVMDGTSVPHQYSSSSSSSSVLHHEDSFESIPPEEELQLHLNNNTNLNLATITLTSQQEQAPCVVPPFSQLQRSLHPNSHPNANSAHYSRIPRAYLTPCLRLISAVAPELPKICTGR